MARRLLAYDAATRTRTYHDYDHATKQTIITDVQDVQPFIERNKKLASMDEYKRHGIKSDWYHFATIPNSVLLKFKREHNLDYTRKEDLPKIEKLLMSNEYKYLRTVGRI